MTVAFYQPDFEICQLAVALAGSNSSAILFGGTDALVKRILRWQESFAAKIYFTYRAGAVQLSIFEYDQEWHMRCLKEEAREEGREEVRREVERERKRAEKAEQELEALKKELALLKEKV